MHLDTAVACALIGLVTGWFVPLLIRAVPEPDPNPNAKPVDPSLVDGEPLSTSDGSAKILYADIAATPGLAWQSSLASGLAAGIAGLTLGWVWPLTMWVFLAPVGVALAVVDLRTWLLPTRIIRPSYALVLALGIAGAVIDRSYDDLLRGLLGTVAAFILFRLLNALPGSGMGYGDVRLSTILGLVLGYLGWAELTFGLWTGFLLGSVGWIPLRLLRITKSKRFPFGPFMLLGALAGVVWGADVAGYLAA